MSSTRQDSEVFLKTTRRVKMDFTQWIAELQRLLVEAGYCLTEKEAKNYASVDVWKVYYEGGYTPQEAVSEEFSYV
jgi:hypothetical protein